MLPADQQSETEGIEWQSGGLSDPEVPEPAGEISEAKPRGKTFPTGEGGTSYASDGWGLEIALIYAELKIKLKPHPPLRGPPSPKGKV